MYRTPNSLQMLTYFSQFLNQIGAVMINIKTYMYDLLEVQMPHPKVDTVYNSMSSIVLSTHKTFADLKKIESVIAGMSRSRQTSKEDVSLNSTSSTQRRSRSQQQSISAKQTFTECSTPRSSLYRQISKQSPKHRFQLNRQNGQELKQKTAKKTVRRIGTSFNSQYKQEMAQQRSYLKEVIENQLNQLLKKNRKRFEQISTRNNQCLDVLKQIAKQLCTN